MISIIKQFNTLNEIEDKLLTINNNEFDLIKSVEQKIESYKFCCEQKGLNLDLEFKGIEREELFVNLD